MKGATNKQLGKAVFISEIFERFEKTELSIREFCRKEGIHTSRFYYWKDRFYQQGRKGLIDRRHGQLHKITEPIKQYIQSIASDISMRIEKKFNTKISDRHIQRILKELGLNDPVGRKTGKPIKKTRVLRT
jgi:transposase